MALSNLYFVADVKEPVGDHIGRGRTVSSVLLSFTHPAIMYQ